jgi:hypothetical protein
MARPRVFISSTFYDLRHIRADLERAIKELGYEPILHERGQVPYGSTEKLEEYCYNEIQHCDIVVAIIGGRYGSESEYGPYSISQVELQTAVKLGKQVYLFIEAPVYSEFGTYLDNKDVEGVRYRYVDSIKVYEFIEEVNALPQNNAIFAFETSADIARYLKEQWAGLFQRFLQDQSRLGEVRMMDDLRGTVKTLNQLVTFLTEERRNSDAAIKDILVSNHPVFRALEKVVGVQYRVFFTNSDELGSWLEARGYAPVDPQGWDEDTEDTHEEWIRSRGTKRTLLKIATHLFDDNGKLKVYTADEWIDDWVQVREWEVPAKPHDDDDLPF